MANSKQGQGKAKGSGGRTTVLAGILAIVSLVALWLSDCIPGFGMGSTGEGEGEADQEKAEPAEPEPDTKPDPKAEREAAPKQLRIIVDARGCIIGGAEPQECESLCDDAALFEGVEEVIVDAKEAPHGKAVAVLDCVKAKDLPVALERD